MSEARITHDHAVAASSEIYERIKPVFMDAELRDLREILYETIRTAIASAFTQRDREISRLSPIK